MAERLFRGQIQPAARPLGSFLQPQQNNIPGATQLTSMPRGSQIATLQQAGTSSVAGFNQIQQLADSLKPFSAELQRSVDRGMRQYAIGNIEAGYYDTLKNEEVKARLRAQENKEEGAFQSAALITKIEAADPVAGELAREVNPWRAVGRNRALAQLAASQVGSLLNAELQKPGYAGIKPGSGQLMQAKEAVTQRLLNRFGLTGDELEFTYYVTPSINKGWDKFSKEQAKIYNAENTNSTIATTSAAISTFFDGIKQDQGITIDGVFYSMDSDNFATEAAEQLTSKIDKGLALLAGEDKEKAWEQIKKTLGYWAGSGTNRSLEIVQQVGIGPSRDATSGLPIDYEKRPKYFDAYPLELTDNTNTALKARNEENSQRQAILASKFRTDFFKPEGPMGAPFGTAEFQARYQELITQYANDGLQNANQLGTQLVTEYQETSGIVNAPTVEEQFGIVTALEALKPEDLDTPEKLQAIIEQIDKFAMGTSGGDQATFTKTREDLMKILEKKQQNFGTVAQNIGLQGNLTRFVNEDLADSGIQDLLEDGIKFQPGLSYSDMIANSTALTRGQKKAYLNFSNEVRAMYQREYDRLATQWWGENPNASLMPQGKAAELLNDAKNNVRKDIRYEQLKQRAINAGKPPAQKTVKPTTEPGAQSTNSQGTQPASPVQPVQFTQDNSGSATAQQVKKYTTTQVMANKWIADELQSILDKGYASPAMNDFANKAGTSSAVLIRRQLDLFSSTDPAKQKALDEYKAKLDEYINRQSSSELPGQANYEYAMAPSAATYNPRAPGAWLMAELFPVVV